ncbi:MULTISPECIES: hypothetical protein [Hymenobacter]|uniref:Lipocalin-like domain-containing protein n=1 Tax=Hymenobacter mucosus TaxID=1411120 RepID=A0A238VIW8_9BACT|nr:MULTISPECIES: hypothetical protein [Hymenobacter]SNR34315.1 hypothetical protein SAMN06269173_101748 [Hymenobacter mucosus]
MRYLLLVCLLVAAALPAWAQDNVVGRWALELISYEARHTLPDSLVEKLYHSPAGETNNAIRNGTLTVQVEYRADGTYNYSMQRRLEAQPYYTEHGRYSVQNGVLRSYATAQDAAAADAQTIIRLNRKLLEVEFPIWAPELHVFEQLRYRRLP